MVAAMADKEAAHVCILVTFGVASHRGDRALNTRRMCGIRFRLPEDGFVFRKTGLPEEFALLPEDRFVFQKTKSVFQKTDRSSGRPKRNMHKSTKNSQ